MKTHLVTFLFSALALILPATLPGAEDIKKADDKKPDDRPVLAIVIAENLQNPGSAIDDVVRLEIAFEEVAKKRKWPVKLVTERFAAGVPDYETEVHIFSQPVRRELQIELVYRAWTYLQINKKKTDFGMIEYRHNPRLGENMSDTLDKVFLGYANKVADAIEPILFPKPAKTPEKPKS